MGDAELDADTGDDKTFRPGKGLLSGTSN